VGSAVFVSKYVYIYTEFNSRVAGIGEAQWAFRTVFEVTEKEMTAENLDIVFEGVDTFAKVELVSLSAKIDRCYGFDHHIARLSERTEHSRVRLILNLYEHIHSMTSRLTELETNL
jgi:hypothetical protein